MGFLTVLRSGNTGALLVAVAFFQLVSFADGSSNNIFSYRQQGQEKEAEQLLTLNLMQDIAPGDQSSFPQLSLSDDGRLQRRP